MEQLVNTRILIESVKYYRHSAKILEIIFTQKEFICRVKWLCRYFLMAALNFALSFLKIVTLGSKLLKIFVLA